MQVQGPSSRLGKDQRQVHLQHPSGKDRELSAGGSWAGGRGPTLDCSGQARSAGVLRAQKLLLLPTVARECQLTWCAVRHQEKASFGRLLTFLFPKNPISDCFYGRQATYKAGWLKICFRFLCYKTWVPVVPVVRCSTGSAFLLSRAEFYLPVNFSVFIT